MKAIVIIGKERDTENYTLLIDRNYTSVEYDNMGGDYNNFLNKVSTNFAEIIFRQKSSLELGVLNGFKINKQGFAKIEKLDNKLFESMLINKLTNLSELCGGKSLIFPLINRN